MINMIKSFFVGMLVMLMIGGLFGYWYHKNHPIKITIHEIEPAKTVWKVVPSSLTPEQATSCVESPIGIKCALNPKNDVLGITASDQCKTAHAEWQITPQMPSSIYSVNAGYTRYVGWSINPAYYYRVGWLYVGGGVMINRYILGGVFAGVQYIK